MIVPVGVTICLSTKLRRVGYLHPSNTTECCTSSPWGLYTITVANDNGDETVFQAEALLNATGRSPNVFNCGLDKVKMENTLHD
jgi:pyruvate/2-oxoglutarate dehydrogenase complex dihydrolipoamide dehydrogenase (E3) component